MSRTSSHSSSGTLSDLIPWIYLSFPLYNHMEKEMVTHSSTLPGKSHGWRILVAYSPWGRKELDTTEQLHFHFCHNEYIHVYFKSNVSISCNFYVSYLTLKGFPILFQDSLISSYNSMASFFFYLSHWYSCYFWYKLWSIYWPNFIPYNLLSVPKQSLNNLFKGLKCSFDHQ